MLKTAAFAALVSLSSLFVVRAAEPTLGERVDQLVPHAAGVALVEVMDIKEVDARPSDGNLCLNVRFRILRSSGQVRDNVNIVKAYGGMGPANMPKPKPYGPVKPDTFRKGECYWIAFASQYDWKRCPQGVVNAWPEKGGSKLLEEAIRADHYAHRPQYDPQSGLTHSYRTEKDKQSWRVRMERDGKLLWEVHLPGEKFRGQVFDGEWRLLRREQWPSGLGHADKNHSGLYLFAETAKRLEQANGYQLPAGNYRLTYALDADTGKTAAIWVSRVDASPTATPSVVQYFDLKTGKVRREERYGLLEKGGLAAGAKEERWLQKIVRTYDPKTSQFEGEEVFRWTESPEGSKYVPVNKR
jgi:hypothetical protein